MKLLGPKILTLFISFFLLNTSSHAQTTQIGLLCVAPGEIPMIFKANLTAESSQYFSLSQGIWQSFRYTEVRIEELILMPRYSPSGVGNLLRASRGLGKVHVNRTTLEWETRENVDLEETGPTTRRGSCTVHTYSEIDQIAVREYSRLNNTRAF
jgi:hypothetical protein